MIREDCWIFSSWEENITGYVGRLYGVRVIYWFISEDCKFDNISIISYDILPLMDFTNDFSISDLDLSIDTMKVMEDDDFFQRLNIVLK